jgi:hypothetical protein
MWIRIRNLKNWIRIRIKVNYRLEMEPLRTMNAHNGGVEAQKRSPGGSVDQWSRKIRITLMRNRKTSVHCIWY